MSEWSWQAALIFVMCAFLVVVCVVAFALALFQRWHNQHFRRIPNAKLNEHRITPRFHIVGNDAKGAS